MDEEFERKISEAKQFLLQCGYEIRIRLDRFDELYGEDCEWVDSSLEKALASMDDINLDRSKWEVCQAGDIVNVTEFTLLDGKQPVFGVPKAYLIIDPTNVEYYCSMLTQEDEESMVYSGFALTSEAERSNRAGGNPNYLYIDNYSTILAADGRYDASSYYFKEAVLKVDEIVEFTDANRIVRRKGTVSEEFMEFVQTCSENYANGISNAENRWEGRADPAPNEAEE